MKIKPNKIKDGITDIVSEVVEQDFVLLGTLAEAKYNSESMTADLTVIKKGWSKNGFYYGDTALESIVNHINNGTNRIYLNHNNMSKVFAPRLAQDHIANNMTAKVSEDGNSVLTTAKFFKSGPNKWVFERMQETPDTFGPSIVGKAKVRQGEVEGRKGPIVESLSWMYSYDMVGAPSAGGKVNAVYESENIESGMYVHVSEGFEPSEYTLATAITDPITIEQEDLSEGMLKDKLKKMKDREKAREDWWDLERMFTSELSNIVQARGDYEFVSIKERKALIEPILDEFTKELKKIKLVEPKALPTTDTKVSTKEGVDSMKNLAELKAENSVLYEALIAEAQKDTDVKAKVLQWKADSDKLSEVQESFDKATAESTSKQEKIETLETTVKNLEKKNDEFVVEQSIARKKELIIEVKTEVGLTEDVCSDVFNKVLEGIEFDSDKEDEFKATIKEHIEDRKTSSTGVKPVKKVIGNGAPVVEKTTVESIVPDSKTLAAQIRG